MEWNMVAGARSLKKLLTTTLCLLSFCCLAQANSLSCYSYIPYGYLEHYNKLIESTNDCYFYFKRPIKFKTGAYGERIIGDERADKTIVAIGESQLMGMDWSDDEASNSHDLNILFSSANFKLFVAPNNGPLQNLFRLRDTHDDILVKAHNIIIGFNFSTDIFRILKNWDHKGSSPISFEAFQLPFFKYALFDFYLLNARRAGIRFGDKVPNNSAILHQYGKINKDNLINEYIDAMDKLIQYIIKRNKNVSLIIYPPYWGLDNNGRLRSDIKQDYARFICASFERLSDLKNIYYAENEVYRLSEDGRHYPQASLKYTQGNSCSVRQQTTK
ncbi:MAG: hypothetical protein FJX80_08250 [Bacteroidetes bacterium]|nr:hypothetical protein [Bacteroidota bacterium]